MSWPTESELERLVSRFRATTLPKTEWTHAAHLVVGTWHVDLMGPEAARDHLRGAIQRLNDSHGTINSDTSGYHETVTHGYAVLIAQFLVVTPGSLVEKIRTLLASPLAARDALFHFYSRDRLLGVEARRGLVPPDLRELTWPLSVPEAEVRAPG